MENDPVTQFAEALRDTGLMLKGDPVFDDKIHRVDVEGKPGGRDGSYKAKIDGDRAFGWFRNWTIHAETQPWHANGDHRLTREQRRHLAEERATQNAARDKALHEQQETAAAECEALWNGALPVETHPYLARKGVPSYGLRQGAPGQTLTITGDDGAQRIIDLAGRLFVPMHDVQGKLWSLQYISDDGRKRYHPGGRKDGRYHLIRSDGAVQHLFIAEGYATGASVHELSGKCPVAIAFDAGNLIAVARAHHALRPDVPPIIAADNDHTRERETGPDSKPKPNIGKLAARAAAEAVGGIALLPEFVHDDPSTDWNDVHQAKGVDEARVQFWRALHIAERQKTGVQR
jgi:putative DNA primase/helicase